MLENKHISEQKIVTIWLTGLSGSGKTTISSKIGYLLCSKQYKYYLLDGDIIRTSLNSDLGFSKEDRKENIRRISEICKILNYCGLIVIVSVISPSISDRKMAKEIIGDFFKEVFVNTSIETCESRDVKGLYKKARNGEITNFTGINDTYESPINPDFIVNTESSTPMETALLILDKLYPDHLKRTT